MPRNEVSDPITDQEMAFAHLILSGAMNDRRAAEAVGLNPDAAVHTKSKPSVRDYMLQHRAAVQKQPVQRAVEPVEGLHPFNPDRDQVLARLWQIANLSPEITRGSVTGQVKSLSIIVAMENFIPDRRAVSAEKKPPTAQIYQSAWLRQQKAATQATANDPQPTPSTTQEEDPSSVPACPGVPWTPEPASSSGAAVSGAQPQSGQLRPSRSPRGRPAAICLPFHYGSRHQSSFLDKKEPLCPPPPLSCKYRKTTQKYRILKIAAS